MPSLNSWGNDMGKNPASSRPIWITRNGTTSFRERPLWTPFWIVSNTTASPYALMALLYGHPPMPRGRPTPNLDLPPCRASLPKRPNKMGSKGSAKGRKKWKIKRKSKPLGKSGTSSRDSMTSSGIGMKTTSSKSILERKRTNSCVPSNSRALQGLRIKRKRDPESTGPMALKGESLIYYLPLSSFIVSMSSPPAYLQNPSVSILPTYPLRISRVIPYEHKRVIFGERWSDINALAFQIVQEATKEPTLTPIPESTKEKNPAAVTLGRLGGLKGGPARAKSLSSKKRKTIAKLAAKARWGKR